MAMDDAHEYVLGVSMVVAGTQIVRWGFRAALGGRHHYPHQVAYVRIGNLHLLGGG
jgi:hypothetical protein